jgi:hypothetical protein
MFGTVKNGIAESAPPGNKFCLSSGQGVNIPERRQPAATVTEGFIVIIINTFQPLSNTRDIHKIYI